VLADAGQPIQFRVACDETRLAVLMLADWEYRRAVLNRGRDYSVSRMITVE